MRKVMQTVEEHYGNAVDISKEVPGGLALNVPNRSRVGIIF